jgi:hypothetical protein
MDPTNDFWPWIRGLIEPCYRSSLDQLWGVTKAEFRDRCIHKVFAWAKANPSRLRQADFTDAKLAKFIRTLARNEQISIWRRMRKLTSLESHWDGTSGYADEAANTLRAMPASIRVEPADPFASRYEILHVEFLQARAVMPFFHRSLKGKKRMRQVLALLLRLGRRLGKKKGFPAYWYLYRILRRKGKHLPDYLRGFLKNRFSHLEYKVINSRLGYLRRAFRKFLL